MSNTEINLRATLHFLTKGRYFSSTCQKIFMDVSEFDPEFKVRMHSAAMALSESMAGRSTLFYVFSPLLKFSEQSVQQSHQTAFLHFEELPYFTWDQNLWLDVCMGQDHGFEECFTRTWVMLAEFYKTKGKEFSFVPRSLKKP